MWRARTGWAALAASAGMAALATVASAAGDAPVPPPSATVAPLLRMLGAVGGLAALAWGLTAFARRRSLLRTGTDHRIDLLATRSLGPRHRVALIAVGARRFLIGIGGDAIRPIAELHEIDGFEESLDDALPALDDQPLPEPLPRADAGGRARARAAGASAADSVGAFEGVDV